MTLRNDISINIGAWGYKRASITYQFYQEQGKIRGLNHFWFTGDYNCGEMGNQDATLTDIELLRQSVAGDEVAFSELYNRHSASIFNYLAHMVNEYSVAEDILQEVFIAAWKGAHKFKGEAKVKTWLFHIAHNLVVSWWRKNRNIQRLNEDHFDLGHPSPESAAIESWYSESVSNALSQLSPAHRAVIELTFYHELSYLEIAQVLGCPVGTVKSRMSYARQYLSKALLDVRVEYRLRGSEA